METSAELTAKRLEHERAYELARAESLKRRVEHLEEALDEIANTVLLTFPWDDPRYVKVANQAHDLRDTARRALARR